MKGPSTILIVILLTISSLLPIIHSDEPANSGTLYVGCSCLDNYTMLQSAIDDASSEINPKNHISFTSVVFYPEDTISNQLQVKIDPFTFHTIGLTKGKMIGDQSHPSIASNNNGSHLISYYNTVDNNTYFGTINGAMAAWDITDIDYPSVKHWNDTHFYATASANSTGDSGSYFIFDIPNPTDMNDWVGYCYDWPNQQGWYNMSDCEIVCDSSLENWNFGFISLIASNNVLEMIDAPHVIYCVQEDSHVISWVSNANHSAHIDACIDKITKKAYSVSDRIEGDSWQLFLNVRDFTDEMNVLGNYDITGIGNLTNPKINVYNDNMIIVAETDQDNNKDILCIYGPPTDYHESFISISSKDEKYPNIEHLVGDTFICSFISQNTLFYAITTNAGISWTQPIEFKNSVVEDYKTTDFSESIDYIGYEKQNDSCIDVVFEYQKGTIILVDDDFDTTTPGWNVTHFNSIQDGIDAVAENGTVYIYNGTYYENVVVNKTIDLIGEDRNNTIIDGGGIGDVVYVSADWVNISGFCMINSGGTEIDAGIDVCSNFNSISGNTVSNNCNGIGLSSFSNYNTISGNTVSNNSDIGMCLSYTNSNNIDNNKLINNDVNIYLLNSNDNNITYNNITSDKWGIWLGSSNDNNILDNTIANITYDGVSVLYSSNNTIMSNIITDCNGEGVNLYHSSFNTINENTITKNNYNDGVKLVSSNNNMIIFNNVSNNKNGIYLASSVNNSVMGNSVNSNNWYGLYVVTSIGNTIYNNYFNNVNNFYSGENNIWNINKTLGTNIIGGPYLGGNYWSDYNGYDVDGDGIGDVLIPYGPGDYLPLTNVQLDINQSIFDRGFPVRHALDGDWAGAQNFTPTLDTVTKVEIYLRKMGSPEFDLTVELWEDGPSALFGGTLLDTVVFPIASVPSSWTWFDVDFNDISVGVGSDVFIVIPPAPSGVTTSFGYEWGYALGNQYDDGSFWFTRDGGVLWRDLPTMYEFTFRTYGYS